MQTRRSLTFSERLPLPVVLLLAATAVRLYHLQSQSLWFDEAIAVHAASQPGWLAVVRADPTNPPLYACLLHLSLPLTGDSLFALRWPSAMLGLLGVALTLRLARRLGGHAAGLFAGLLAAFSPILWWASQEVRMYGLMAGLLLIAAEAWFQLVLDSGRPRAAWLRLWAAEALLLYTHTSAPVAVLWLNLVTPLVWLSRRSLRRPDARVWVIGQAGVAAIWLPWFFSNFLGVKAANALAPAHTPLDLTLLNSIWQAFWAAAWTMVGHEPILTALSGFFLALALVIIPWRTSAARWLAVHCLTLTASLVVALKVLDVNLHQRYLVMIAPLVLVLIGLGLSNLARRFRLGRLLAGGLSAVFVLTFGLNVYWVNHNAGYTHDDVVHMVEYYAAHLGPDDSVLAWSYVERYELQYYWSRLNVPAQLLTLAENTDLETLQSRLPRQGSLARNIWYNQHEDYRGMLPCVLEHGAVNKPEVFSVNGMSNELYRSPQDRIEWQTADQAWEVGRVTRRGQLAPFAADQALCLPVEIRLDHPLASEVKVAVSVKNTLEQVVARADAPFADALQRTSDQAATGDVLTAFPLLRLPYGAPPGVYTVSLVVYDETNLSGYSVLDAAGAPAGKDWQLGTWVVQPGAQWSGVNWGTDLPVRPALAISPQLVLSATNVATGMVADVTNGDRLPLALLWQGTGALPTLTLAASDGRWQVPIPPSLPQASAGVTLDWREFQIPAEALAGEAALTLPNGTVLARYRIQPSAFLTTAPAFEVPVGQTLPGVGTLVGYSLGSRVLDHTQPVSLTLIWRTGDTPPAASYTVFAQLLGADGTVMAQSDSMPAGGRRPTTGWRPGEYIIDSHQLIFHPNILAGPARLIVGMYDADTLQRLTFDGGGDALTLLTGLEVK